MPSSRVILKRYSHSAPVVSLSGTDVYVNGSFKCSGGMNRFEAIIMQKAVAKRLGGVIV
jgi:hypothetical protein